MVSFLKRVFTPIPITSTRTSGFIAWTAFAVMVLLLVFGVFVWMAFLPQARAQIANGDGRVPGMIMLLGALAVGAQLIWTTSKGYVYCGRVEVVTKTDDALLYRIYCFLHLLCVATFTVGAVLLLC